VRKDDDLKAHMTTETLQRDRDGTRQTFDTCVSSSNCPGRAIIVLVSWCKDLVMIGVITT